MGRKNKKDQQEKALNELSEESANLGLEATDEPAQEQTTEAVAEVVEVQAEETQQEQAVEAIVEETQVQEETKDDELSAMKAKLDEALKKYKNDRTAEGVTCIRTIVRNIAGVDSKLTLSKEGAIIVETSLGEIKI